ncbi:MAG: YajD family HNH nuclease [Candidatus Hydrogenedentes bacterium]|nr:YajD family HNH nuclease [Candidatus Hydrogenedentota bacterium]
MRRRLGKLDPVKKAEFLARVQREQADRQKGYREQALALFPHVCARCGKEFSGKSLSELTVHHKDSNHMNNPPDGSNWELLCTYCHEDEHGAYERVGSKETKVAYSDEDSSEGFNPFAGLKNLIKPSDAEEGRE